jgi:predicted RNase H-like HicB family nuclease
MRDVVLSQTNMASSTRDGAPHDAEIRLWREDDWWVAKDVETGVTTQGESRNVALANLDEAVTLYNDEVGEAPTDKELREMGIDPADNTTGEQEPPDVLK